MSEPKTKPTTQSVVAFLKKLPDAQKRADAAAVVAMMQETTKDEPVMWGASIIGFGSHHTKYESGREGDWPMIALSPRKRNLTLYIMSGFGELADELKNLGPHSTGKSCLYINRLAEIDISALKKIVVKSVRKMKTKAAA